VDVITSDLTTWLIRHAKWGAAEAQELSEKEPADAMRVAGRLDGNPIERRRWLRTSLYERAPLFLRAFAYFFYRYFLRLGFLDGKEGLIFHFLQGCFFRFYVDAKIYENRRAGKNQLRIGAGQFRAETQNADPKSRIHASVSSGVKDLARGIDRH
jgi:hypothetical protein